eukprot:TRINITY_DN878_c0_g1_i4.p1 TRINITY_DN878_c0_g1~~TRINITY_DN878_c0_g1_i4.p1  ORF type:complete len:292 (+),score=56.36 TRINITY_DN878_c0_g1_i4:103-876(+)
MADSWKDGWCLYYWPGIGGRGLYIRLMFALGGAEYEDRLRPLRPERVEDIPGSWEEVGRKVAEIRKDELSGDFPHMAMPIITNRKRGFCMNQVPAILLFLGDLFGLKPSDPVDAAHATQLLMQVTDVLSEVEAVYHPNARHASYYAQKEDADKAVASWLDERFDKHFSVLENALVWGKQKRGTEEGWPFFEKVTFVDVSVATLMRGYFTSLPKHYAEHAKVKYPSLCAHREAFEAHGPVKQFYAQWDGPVDDNSFMG